MDPLIAAAESADAPDPQSYEIGSDGPECGAKLLANDGRTWQPIG